MPDSELDKQIEALEDELAALRGQQFQQEEDAQVKRQAEGLMKLAAVLMEPRISRLEQQLAEAQEANTHLDERLAQALTDLDGIKRLFEEEREGRIQYQHEAARLLDTVKKHQEELAQYKANTEWYEGNRQQLVREGREARALLDDAVTLMMLTRTTDVLRSGTSTPLYEQIRAYLERGRDA